MMNKRPLSSKILDPFVPLAFGAPGYHLAKRAFVSGDLDVDLRGRVCLVTGANAGLGRATALGLARRGAEVRLLCRDAARGEEARAAIAREAAPAGGAAFLDVVDLANVDAIRSYVERLPAERVHVLVQNAGVLVHQRIETRRGLELTFATNVVGPFLLTQLLAPRLAAAGDARVVFVSSGGMLTQKLDLDALTSRRAAKPFDGTVVYAQTKRAEVVIAERFAERLRSSGVFVASMHPGWVDTRSLATALPAFHRATRRLLRSAEQGADTMLWLSACPRLSLADSGRFWFDRAPRRTHVLPFSKDDPTAADALWSLCEQSVGEAR